MNVQEKMTMLKCYAYQKRESQGIEGKETAIIAMEIISIIQMKSE